MSLHLNYCIQAVPHIKALGLEGMCGLKFRRHSICQILFCNQSKCVPIKFTPKYSIGSSAVCCLYWEICLISEASICFLTVDTTQSAPQAHLFSHYKTLLKTQPSIKELKLWNHPKTIPHLVYGKTVFHETSPWCQNVWGLLLKDKPGGVRQDTPGWVTQHKPGWGKTGQSSSSRMDKLLQSPRQDRPESKGG